MLWNNFEIYEFVFEGHKASVVKPKSKIYNPVLVLKTEYRDVFPETEIEFLNRGCHVAFIGNGNLNEKAYKEADPPIDIFIKPGYNHHPHGLKNPEITIDCILNKISNLS